MRFRLLVRNAVVPPTPKKIGIPRETLRHEHRVGLTPLGVSRIREFGGEVLVQHDAGHDSHFLDRAFVEAGASIVYDSKERAASSRQRAARPPSVARIATTRLEENRPDSLHSPGETCRIVAEIARVAERSARMADKLLIVHGYSDGSTSFSGLGDFFIEQGIYRPENVFYLDYSSMDDDATFHDFADKLDADHRKRLGGERVDVACHSTGSLVVRAWLALHQRRAAGRGLEEPCPIDRLLCFAPANFGSDLAGLGQSFLGKFRTTFFNSHSHKSDFMESGKVVLQGLEPASPFQWEVSVNHDLHGARTYFRERRPDDKSFYRPCFPLVLAAGTAYGGVQAKLIKQRAMLGTDGTVRIPGTSLNTRGCSLDFRENGPKLIWWPESKFSQIPFAVFAGFNHGSIIDPKQPGFTGPDGPGTLALEALGNVHDFASYEKTATRFSEATEANYRQMPEERRDRYQQFFFRVRDDVDQLVDDFYIDFHVEGRDRLPHEALTVQFDEDFEAQVYRHSVKPSYRVFLMNCSELARFDEKLRAEGGRLVIEIAGVSKNPDVSYEVSAFVAYDPNEPRPGEPTLLYPNTTTLVDVILNRRQTDKLLVIKDGRLTPLPEEARPIQPLTGRAALVRGEGA